MPAADGRLTAGEVAQIAALVRAQANVRTQLTDSTLTALLAVWQAVTNWWDRKQTSQAIERTLRLAVPAQRRMAQITDVYLTRAVAVMTGRRVRPVGAVDVTRLRRALDDQTVRDLVEGRRAVPYVWLGVPRSLTALEPTRRPPTTPPAGVVPQSGMVAMPDPGPDQVIVELGAGTAVDPADVWGRIPDFYRKQVVIQGLSDEQATIVALRRAEKVFRTDMALAVRAQARKVLNDPSLSRQVIGWRRVIRPEMSQYGPCGLCVVAADRIYHKRELMPLHPACVCEVLPITAMGDPGLILNDQDLKRIYAAAGSTRAADLRRLRNVAITEHGELGPVLVPAGQKVRGPKQVAETQSTNREVSVRAQLAALEKTFAQLQAREARGEDVRRPLAWQRDRLAELRRELSTLTGV